MFGDDWTPEYVPASAVRLYRMCWQLETWLRNIVYVELRASRIDWEKPIEERVSNWPPRSLKNDAKLHHMATPHQSGLSYLTFGQLWSVISDPANWPLFEPYFPPEDITSVRIKEIKAIRNRVAHFREPHAQDVARLDLFIHEMEPGIRRFCSRYTVGACPPDPADDPVSTELAAVWEHHGHGIELNHPRGWLYAPEPYRHNPVMNAELELLPHRQCSRGSGAGVIYRVRMTANSGQMDVVQILQRTKSLHKDLIHVMLSASPDELSVTIPAVHGPARTTEILLGVLSAGLNNSRGIVTSQPNRARHQWPEYVLWPNHLLALYFEELQEPLLDP